MALTSAEETFFTDNTAVPHADVVILFSNYTIFERQDIALVATAIGLENRNSLDVLGGLYYKAVTDYPSALLDDVYNFITGDSARYIYPQHETKLIPRAPLSVFRQWMVHLALWDTGTGTWEAALSEQDVKDELAKLFHHFGHSGETGWERMAKYEMVLGIEEQYGSLSSTTPSFIPTGVQVGINLPTDGWGTTEEDRVFKWDCRTFLAEVFRDTFYLQSLFVTNNNENTDNLNAVGVAIRNVQIYDINNIAPDRLMLTTASYINSEVRYSNAQSFRQIVVDKAILGRAEVSW